MLTGKAKLRVVSCYRSFAEQNKLYSRGRSLPGPKVTNAKGGYSMHNFGLAFDICLIINGKEASWDTIRDYDEDGKADWMEVVEYLKGKGFKWGGDWKTLKDMPHFEVGIDLATLRQAYNDKLFIAGTEYVDLYKLKGLDNLGIYLGDKDNGVLV